METTTSQICSSGRYFEQRIFVREAILERDYLGTDIQKICAIAGEIQETLLIAQAGFPLKERENAFRVWRAACVSNAFSNAGFQAAFALLPADIKATALAGDLSLSEMERLLKEEEGREAREKSEKRRAVKNVFFESLAKEAGGNPDAGCVRACRFIAFRPSLGLKMFKNYEVAKTWVREGRDLEEGGVFWSVDQESVRVEV